MPISLHDLCFAIVESNALFEFLPLRELLIIAGFSPLLKHYVQLFVLRRFHDTFGRQLGDFEDFCAFWRTQKFYLTGSSVLHFITQDEGWMPKDLDFVVGRNHVEPLLAQLKQRGFHPYETEIDASGSSHSVQYVLNRDIHAIYRLAKSDRKLGMILIDVVESTLADPLSTICYFHSTQVMNFMTADSLTMLYPDLTMEHIGVIREHDYDIDHLVQKYKQRGFEMYDFVSFHPPSDRVSTDC